MSLYLGCGTSPVLFSASHRLGGMRLHISLSPGQLGSNKTQYVSLWLISFSLEKNLLRKTECSGIFQNGSFFPLPAGSMREFFFQYSLWGPGGKTGTGTPLWLWLTEFLFLRLVHTEPPTICQLQLRFPYLSTDSCGDCRSRVSAPVSCNSQYLSVDLSNLGGSSLPYDLTSSMDLRRVVNFSVCSGFYLLLGWSGVFQASYMLDWKTTVIKFSTYSCCHNFITF